MDARMMRTAVLLVVLSCSAAGCGSAPAPQASSTRHATHHDVVVHHLRNHHASIPILEYHVIGLHALGSPLEGLYVPPAELLAQADWLERNGWHSVTLGQVARYWRHGVALPRKPVVLSFDDGYPGDWRYAMPILRARHFVGVLNLQIGNLVPMRVRELIRAGWEIDAHTFTHPDLRQVDRARQRREVSGSRRWLQRTFGIPVPAFCYPFGLYDARTVSEVRRAGYLVAETERQGWASPVQGMLTLSRIRVTPTDGVRGLAAWLGG
jgi:peptidoglycan/xylan/chitin deacetylase (PgdA/CDA1 family)